MELLNQQQTGFPCDELSQVDQAQIRSGVELMLLIKEGQDKKEPGPRLK